MILWGFLFWLLYGGPPVDCVQVPGGQVCQIGQTTGDTPQILLGRRR